MDSMTGVSNDVKWRPFAVSRLRIENINRFILSNRYASVNPDLCIIKSYYVDKTNTQILQNVACLNALKTPSKAIGGGRYFFGKQATCQYYENKHRLI